MSKLQRPLTIVAGPLLASLLLLPGSGASACAAETAVAPRITVSARDAGLSVEGLDSARAGYTRIVVRNDGRGEHGIALVRLKVPLTSSRLLQAFAAEKRNLIESLGGIQAVVPGRPWEMTARLAPGEYALIDFAQNGPDPNYARGLYKRFRVAPSPDAGAPPPIVGEIGLRDFRFDVRLPERFSGHGIVKFPNLGRTPHEITLVRIDRRHTQRDVLKLILAGATAPPEWASIVELLSVLDPGKTAYVRLDLRPGRYVALCLIDRRGSHKLHAELGMIATFDVI